MTRRKTHIKSVAENSQSFSTSTRPELTDDYRVFYVTAWGYAADHWLGWFPKALNSHPELFALLAHEGSRPKYFSERTRGDRPDLVPYTEFMNDMSMTYQFSGDCYSWRAVQTKALKHYQRYRNIPVLNLVRHPATWLEFYVNWRSANMRMREGSIDPLTWEWKVARHRKFQSLALKSYQREDVNIWASHQGMVLLNGVLSDLDATPHHLQVERIVNRTEVFQQAIAILTNNTIQYTSDELDVAYSMLPILFRGEVPTNANPHTLMESWPGWKVDAFRLLVSDRSLDAYKNHGYNFDPIEKKSKTVNVKHDASAKPDRDIFVSTIMKSGTWLLRDIVSSITGLDPHEPEIDLKSPPGYDDEMKIEFPKGKFFIWHSEINARTRSLLAGCNSINLYLLRNIYDLLVSMTNHIQYDVDAGMGRSTGGKNFFNSISPEQALSMMICGFTAPQITWNGLRPHIRQMASMIRHAREGFAHLVYYENLVNNKKQSIEQIASILNADSDDACISDIIERTSPKQFQSYAAAIGSPDHVTPNERRNLKQHISQSHVQMVNHILWQELPECVELSKQKKYEILFTLAGEPLRLPGAG